MIENSYSDWLSWRNDEWHARRDSIAAYYRDNPRVLAAEKRVERARRAKSVLETKLAYARTGRRSAVADRLMGVTGVATADIERAYYRAAHDHAAAWLRVAELR